MPNKYFSPERIKDATIHLQACDRKWLLIPFVLAVNGVDESAPVDIRGRLGGDKVLRDFFDASLIELEPKTPGKPSTITPVFADLTADDAAHIAKQTDVNLWGNVFSVSGAGYGQLRNGTVLAKTSGGSFQLGPDFSKWLRDNIPSSFKLEDLLTWLYAFSGLPDQISNWADLLDHFLHTKTYEKKIPAPYQSVFSLTPGEPWPADFLSSRPSNKELKELLLSGIGKCEIEAHQFNLLRNVLAELLKREYLGFSSAELDELSISIVSGLQSCRRIFLLGDPGTGKTQLGLLVSAAFEQVFSSRVHTVSAPIADGTTPDKLIGFSTLDGRWVDGILCQPDSKTKRQLLYGVSNGALLKSNERDQINVILLDEVNRRDAEDLLSKLQNALDSEHAAPEHVSNQVKIDNSGERYLSPNTFLLMSGNSPRDDTGRLVQSRPFKRRHNLVLLRNAFERILSSSVNDFSLGLVSLWEKRGSNFVIEASSAKAFSDAMAADNNTMNALQITLQSMDGYAIGLSYGLAKKFLQTAGARFAMAPIFPNAIDCALTESVLPLLSSEVVLQGKGVRESLLAVDPVIRAALPGFFGAVEQTLSPPDAFGRPRQFL